MKIRYKLFIIYFDSKIEIKAKTIGGSKSGKAEDSGGVNISRVKIGSSELWNEMEKLFISLELL